jgi:hypothetical protein
MTAQQPHALRCDNCDHHILQPLMKYPHCCDHPMFRDTDEDGMALIGIDEYFRIGVMGCASHSKSHQHPQAPSIHLCCDKCGSIAPHFDGKDQWLCTKCLQAAVSSAATLAAQKQTLERITLIRKSFTVEIMMERLLEWSGELKESLRQSTTAGDDHHDQ